MHPACPKMTKLAFKRNSYFEKLLLVVIMDTDIKSVNIKDYR